jgi:DNA-binding IscR family transcriptional regulator
MSNLPARRGSKKHKALIALLEVAKKRSIVTMEELVSEMNALGLSKFYTEGLVKELATSGILKRVRGRGLRDRRGGPRKGVERGRIA